MEEDGGIGLRPKAQKRFTLKGRKIGERDFGAERRQKSARQREEEEERQFGERRRQAEMDVHASNLLQLQNIHDGHTQRVYAFAQKIAGSLGAHTRRQMEMVWAGRIPGTSCRSSAAPVCTQAPVRGEGGDSIVTDAQLERLKREIEESVVNRLSVAATPKVELIDEAVGRTTFPMPDPEGNIRGFDPRTPGERGRGREIVAHTVAAATKTETETPVCCVPRDAFGSLIGGEDVLRRRILAPGDVTRPWLEAWKLAAGFSDDPRERFEAVKTVWIGVTHDMAMENFTPLAATAIDCAMDSVQGIAGRTDLAQADLILIPDASRVFAQLVGHHLQRIMNENSGGAADQWRAAQIQMKIVVQARRFQSINIDRRSRKAYFGMPDRLYNTQTSRHRYLSHGRVSRAHDRMRTFAEARNPEPQFVTASAAQFSEDIRAKERNDRERRHSRHLYSSREAGGSAASASAAMIMGTIGEYQDASVVHSDIMDTMFPSRTVAATAQP